VHSDVGIPQQFIEVKGGYGSGARALDQALNYAQLRQETGVPVYYRLYNGGSQTFLDFLERVHIPTL
jgi:acetyl esterase/lipase